MTVGLLRVGLHVGPHVGLRGGLHGGLHGVLREDPHEGQHEDLPGYCESLGGHREVMVQEVRCVENMGSEDAHRSTDEGGLHFLAGYGDFGNVESNEEIGLDTVRGTVRGTVQVEGNRMDLLAGKVLTHLGRMGGVGLEARMDCMDLEGLGTPGGHEGLEGHLGDQEVVEVGDHGGRGRCRGRMLDERRGPVAKRDGADDGGAEGVREGGGALGDVLDEGGHRRVTRQTHCLFGLAGCVVGVAVCCGVHGLLGSVLPSERLVSARGSRVLRGAVEEQQSGPLAAPGKDVWSVGFAGPLGLLCGGVTLSLRGRFLPSRCRGRRRTRLKTRVACA